MISEYFKDGMEAVDFGKLWLRGNTRTHVLVGKTPKGFIVIDPRNAKSHYCQIVAKLFRKQSSVA